MSRYVVDASVALKFYLTSEEFSDDAGSLATSGLHSLVAPEFLIVECTNVFATKVRRSELDANRARLHLAALRIGMELLPSDSLLAPAFDLTIQHGRSVYDSLYVTLALQEGCQLVTADERLYNALQPMFPETMLWISDLTT